MSTKDETLKNQTFYVTKPKLPDLNEFMKYMQQVWSAGQLTNNGQFHRDLEKKLADYLDVEHLVLYSSGTAALIAAIACSGIKGKVITTPYSFIATAHAIKICGLEPIFVDIDKETANIDIKQVQAAITKDVGAVLAVACYGNPSGYTELDHLCKTNGIPFISDSAHAFDVKINSKSIFNIPDISAVSFHATKVFSTIEGGAVICKSPEIADRLRLYRNFGIESEEDIVSIGNNGKLNELCSIYGLLQLDTISDQVIARNNICSYYEERLGKNLNIKLQIYPKNVHQNGSYYPILLSSIELRNFVYSSLKERGIYTRKYFFPLITDTHPYKNTLKNKFFPNATYWAEHVLCLPIYPHLKSEEQDYIIENLLEVIDQF